LAAKNNDFSLGFVKFFIETVRFDHKICLAEQKIIVSPAQIPPPQKVCCVALGALPNL
jgi:hypothetical protein